MTFYTSSGFSMMVLLMYVLVEDIFIVRGLKFVVVDGNMFCFLFLVSEEYL